MCTYCGFLIFVVNDKNQPYLLSGVIVPDLLVHVISKIMYNALVNLVLFWKMSHYRSKHGLGMPFHVFRLNWAWDYRAAPINSCTNRLLNLRVYHYNQGLRPTFHSNVSAIRSAPFNWERDGHILSCWTKQEMKSCRKLEASGRSEGGCCWTDGNTDIMCLVNVP